MTNFSRIYKMATILVFCGAAMFLAAIGQVVTWTFDRKPPFIMKSYVSEPTQRGSMAVVSVKVQRDLSRLCSVTYSRMFLDASGVMWDLTEGVRVMTAKALDELDRRNPDALTIKVLIPAGAALGKGSIMTVLEYVCNPVHQAYPIPLVMLTDVQVLTQSTSTNQ